MEGGEGGGVMPDYKYMHNRPESEFLTAQVEYLQSCDHLVSCLETERSMMKSATVFECGSLPRPPHVHLTSTSRPPHVILVINVLRPLLFTLIFRVLY